MVTACPCARAPFGIPLLLVAVLATTFPYTAVTGVHRSVITKYFDQDDLPPSICEAYPGRK